MTEKSIQGHCRWAWTLVLLALISGRADAAEYADSRRDVETRCTTNGQEAWFSLRAERPLTVWHQNYFNWVTERKYELNPGRVLDPLVGWGKNARNEAAVKAEFIDSILSLASIDSEIYETKADGQTEVLAQVPDQFVAFYRNVYFTRALLTGGLSFVIELTRKGPLPDFLLPTACTIAREFFRQRINASIATIASSPTELEVIAERIGRKFDPNGILRSALESMASAELLSFPTTLLEQINVQYVLYKALTSPHALEWAAKTVNRPADDPLIRDYLENARAMFEAEVPFSLMNDEDIRTWVGAPSKPEAAMVLAIQGLMGGFKRYAFARDKRVSDLAHSFLENFQSYVEPSTERPDRRHHSLLQSQNRDRTDLILRAFEKLRHPLISSQGSNETTLLPLVFTIGSLRLSRIPAWVRDVLLAEYDPAKKRLLSKFLPLNLNSDEVLSYGPWVEMLASRDALYERGLIGSTQYNDDTKLIEAWMYPKLRILETLRKNLLVLTDEEIEGLVIPWAVSQMYELRGQCRAPLHIIGTEPYKTLGISPGASLQEAQEALKRASTGASDEKAKEFRSAFGAIQQVYRRYSGLDRGFNHVDGICAPHRRITAYVSRFEAEYGRILERAKDVMEFRYSGLDQLITEEISAESLTPEELQLMQQAEELRQNADAYLGIEELEALENPRREPEFSQVSAVMSELEIKGLWPAIRNRSITNYWWLLDHKYEVGAALFGSAYAARLAGLANAGPMWLLKSTWPAMKVLIIADGGYSLIRGAAGAHFGRLGVTGLRRADSFAKVIEYAAWFRGLPMATNAFIRMLVSPHFLRLAISTLRHMPVRHPELDLLKFVLSLLESKPHFARLGLNPTSSMALVRSRYLGLKSYWEMGNTPTAREELAQLEKSYAYIQRVHAQASAVPRGNVWQKAEAILNFLRSLGYGAKGEVQEFKQIGPGAMPAQ